MERIGRIAAVAAGVGERADEIRELGDRARVPVGDDEGQRVRLGRTDVQEVDDLTVDHGGELGEPVEPRFVRSPVVVGAPVLGQLLQVSERHAPAPSHARQLVGPAGAGEPVPQVIEVRLGDVDPEGPDLGVGAFGTGHLLVSLLLSRSRSSSSGGSDRRLPYDRMLSWPRRYRIDRMLSRRLRPCLERRPGTPSASSSSRSPGCTGCWPPPGTRWPNRPAKPAHAGGCSPRSRTVPRPSRRSRGGGASPDRACSGWRTRSWKSARAPTRRTPEHRRAQLLRITPRGRRALRTIQAAQRTWADALGEEIGEADLRKANAVLGRAIRAISGQQQRSSPDTVRREPGDR